MLPQEREIYNFIFNMPKKGFGKNFFSFVAVIALLIFFHLLGVLNGIENFLIRTINPVLSIFYSSGNYLQNNPNEEKDKQELLSILNKLQEENNELIAANAMLKVKEEENKELRSYLDFLSEKEYSFVLANVISKKGLDLFGSGQEIFVNKGTRDGLRNGLAVVDNQGIVIGKVISVKDSLSEICLTANNNCKFAVSSQNNSSTSGVSQGDLGITIKMNFIPQTEEIKTGDVIITSGLETDIPRGLVLGRISEVYKESNDVWQSATITPLSASENLNIVSVLLP